MSLPSLLLGLEGQGQTLLVFVVKSGMIQQMPGRVLAPSIILGEDCEEM